jgi:hypothetical protein
VALAAVALSAVAGANFVTGFEDYNADPNGIGLTGQQGWYLPTGSVEHKVYTYTGNAYGFPQNPLGGEKFIAAKSMGATTGYGRAQHDHDFSAGGVWAVWFDMSAQYNGTLPAQDYLGSFSQQPSGTSRYWQTLNVWNDNNNPVMYHTNYITYENAIPGISPGAAWANLLPNHWYRLGTVANFTTNLILSVSIQDLTAGTDPVVYNPTGWHLNQQTLPLPTAVRFFAGGATGGNTMAWDNLHVIPEPVSLAACGLLATLLRRR